MAVTLKIGTRGLATASTQSPAAAKIAGIGNDIRRAEHQIAKFEMAITKALKADPSANVGELEHRIHKREVAIEKMTSEMKSMKSVAASVRAGTI